MANIYIPLLSDLSVDNLKKIADNLSAAMNESFKRESFLKILTKKGGLIKLLAVLDYDNKKLLLERLADKESDLQKNLAGDDAIVINTIEQNIAAQKEQVKTEEQAKYYDEEIVSGAESVNNASTGEVEQPYNATATVSNVYTYVVNGDEFTGNASSKFNISSDNVTTFASTSNDLSSNFLNLSKASEFLGKDLPEYLKALPETNSNSQAIKLGFTLANSLTKKDLQAAPVQPLLNVVQQQDITEERYNEAKEIVKAGWDKFKGESIEGSNGCAKKKRNFDKHKENVEAYEKKQQENNLVQQQQKQYEDELAEVHKHNAEIKFQQNIELAHGIALRATQIAGDIEYLTGQDITGGHKEFLGYIAPIMRIVSQTLPCAKINGLKKLSCAVLKGSWGVLKEGSMFLGLDGLNKAFDYSTDKLPISAHHVKEVAHWGTIAGTIYYDPVSLKVVDFMHLGVEMHKFAYEVPQVNDARYPIMEKYGFLPQDELNAMFGKMKGYQKIASEMNFSKINETFIEEAVRTHYVKFLEERFSEFLEELSLLTQDDTPEEILAKAQELANDLSALRNEIKELGRFATNTLGALYLELSEKIKNGEGIKDPLMLMIKAAKAGGERHGLEGSDKMKGVEDLYMQKFPEVCGDHCASIKDKVFWLSAAETSYNDCLASQPNAMMDCIEHRYNDGHSADDFALAA